MGNLHWIFIHKGRKLFAELSDGSEEKAFNRADGDVQDFGGFIQFEAVVVAHDKNGSFFGGYLLECLRDAVLDLSRFCALYRVKTVSTAGNKIFLDAYVIQFARGLCVPYRFSAEGVDTGVDRDLVEPGAHFGIPAESLQSAKSFHEHLLRDVFSLMMVSSNVVCEVINLLFVPADQIIEGRLISAANAVDKNLIILCHLFLPLLDEQFPGLVYKKSPLLWNFNHKKYRISKDYSYRRETIGLAAADLRVWKPTVMAAIIRANRDDKRKMPTDNRVR